MPRTSDTSVAADTSASFLTRAEMPADHDPSESGERPWPGAADRRGLDC